jgi:hypothetical protein
MNMNAPFRTEAFRPRRVAPLDKRNPPLLGEDVEAKLSVRVWGIADFLAEYKPISYTIDGLLPGRLHLRHDR